MSENSESEVEVDPYGPNLNYSTPMASRASSPLSRDKNEISKAHFNGPIVKCSESEVVSTSTGLVASVTWPDLRLLHFGTKRNKFLESQRPGFAFEFS